MFGMHFYLTACSWPFFVAFKFLLTLFFFLSKADLRKMKMISAYLIPKATLQLLCFWLGSGMQTLVCVSAQTFRLKLCSWCWPKEKQYPLEYDGKTWLTIFSNSKKRVESTLSFWWTSRCLEMSSNTVLSVWYILSVKTKTKEKMKTKL